MIQWSDQRYGGVTGKIGIFTIELYFGKNFDTGARGYRATVCGRRLIRWFDSLEEAKAGATQALKKKLQEALAALED